MLKNAAPGYLAVATLLAAVLTTGCAGRVANPTPEASIFDRYMTCEDIRQEVARNYDEQSALMREKIDVEEENAAIAGFSVAFPPGFFALDQTVNGDYGQSPQEIEASALATRDRHIIALAKEDKCWPDPKVWSPS